MIELICGGMGSGKTERLIGAANAACKDAKGVQIFIDKNDARAHDLDRCVKVVDARAAGVGSAKELLILLEGMTAANYDIERIYIDNIEKLTGQTAESLNEFFEKLETIAQECNIHFLLVINMEKQRLPEFLRKLAA